MRYALLSRLLPLLGPLAFWWLGRREPAWRDGWSQRRGCVAPRDDAPLWLHAASVGEVNAAAGLLAELQARWPDVSLHLTAFTPSGLARWQALAPEASCSLLPLDVPVYARRFLDRVRPRAWVILETECWPVLLAACQARSIPVVWLSGRMTQASEKGLPKLFGPRRLRAVLGAVRAFGLQTPADLERFVTLGAPAARAEVTGSLKLDLTVDPVRRAAGERDRAAWGRSVVWLAASTHDGEERAALAAHRALLARQSDALLLLAPRHPRRADAVGALLTSADMHWCRRSLDRGPDPNTQVLLIDTLGELMHFFAAADFCFVGGSLVPIGGHNLLEPAALGRGILTGPHLHTCREQADALAAAGGLLQVADEGELTNAVLRWATDARSAKAAGQAAQGVLESGRGALARNLVLTQRVLETVLVSRR